MIEKKMVLRLELLMELRYVSVMVRDEMGKLNFEMVMEKMAEMMGALKEEKLWV